MRLVHVCLWLIVGLLSFAKTAPAHPGHGTTNPNTVTHYVTEPVHVVPLLMIVAAAVVLSLLAARRRRSP